MSQLSTRSGPVIHVQDEFGKPKCIPAQSRTIRANRSEDKSRPIPLRLSPRPITKKPTTVPKTKGSEIHTRSNPPTNISKSIHTDRRKSRGLQIGVNTQSSPRNTPQSWISPSPNESHSRGDVTQASEWDAFYTEYQAGLQDFERITSKLQAAKSAVLSRQNIRAQRHASEDVMIRPSTPKRHSTPVKSVSPAYSLTVSPPNKRTISPARSHSVRNSLVSLEHHCSTRLSTGSSRSFESKQNSPANVLRCSQAASQKDITDAVNNNHPEQGKSIIQSQIIETEEDHKINESHITENVAHVVLEQKPSTQTNGDASATSVPIASQRNLGALFGDPIPGFTSANPLLNQQATITSNQTRSSINNDTQLPHSPNRPNEDQYVSAEDQSIKKQVRAAEAAIVRLQSRLAEKNTTISNLAFRARQLEREVRWAKLQQGSVTGNDATQRVQIRELETRLARDADVIERLVHEIKTVRGHEKKLLESQMNDQQQDKCAAPSPVVVDAGLLNQTVSVLEQCHATGMDSIRFPEFASFVNEAYHKLKQVSTSNSSNALEVTSLVLMSLCDLSKAIEQSMKTDVQKLGVNPIKPLTSEKSVQSMNKLTTNSSTETPAVILPPRTLIPGIDAMDYLKTDTQANAKVLADTAGNNYLANTSSQDIFPSTLGEDKYGPNHKMGEHHLSRDIMKIFHKFDTKHVVGSEVDQLLLRLLKLKGENELLRRESYNKNQEPRPCAPQMNPLPSGIPPGESSHSGPENVHAQELNQLRTAIGELSKRLDSQSHLKDTTKTDKTLGLHPTGPEILIQQLDLVTKTNSNLVTQTQTLEQQLMEAQQAVMEMHMLNNKDTKYTALNIDSLHVQEYTRTLNEYQTQITNLAAKVNELTEVINQRDAELERIQDSPEYQTDRVFQEEMNLVMVKLSDAIADQQRQSEQQLKHAQSVLEKASCLNNNNSGNEISLKLAVKIKEGVQYTKTLAQKLLNAEQEIESMHPQIEALKTELKLETSSHAETKSKLEQQLVDLESLQVQLETYTDQWKTFQTYAPFGTPTGHFEPILRNILDQLDQQTQSLDMYESKTEHLSTKLDQYQMQHEQDQVKLSRMAELLARAERSQTQSVTAISEKLRLAQKSAYMSQKRLAKVLRGVYLYVSANPSINPQTLMDSVNRHKEELIKDAFVYPSGSFVSDQDSTDRDDQWLNNKAHLFNDELMTDKSKLYLPNVGLDPLPGAKLSGNQGV